MMARSFVFIVGVLCTFDAILVLATGCKTTLPPEPEVVVFPPYDAAYDAELAVPADCRLACESMAKVGCPESAPAGRTCGSVCAAAVSDRIPGFQSETLLCIANASTPDQIRACGMVRCLGR